MSSDAARAHADVCVSFFNCMQGARRSDLSSGESRILFYLAEFRLRHYMPHGWFVGVASVVVALFVFIVCGPLYTQYAHVQHAHGPYHLQRFKGDGSRRS